MDTVNTKINVANILEEIKMQYYDFHKCKNNPLEKVYTISYIPNLIFSNKKKHHVKSGGHMQRSGFRWLLPYVITIPRNSSFEDFRSPRKQNALT